MMSKLSLSCALNFFYIYLYPTFPGFRSDGRRYADPASAARHPYRSGARRYRAFLAGAAARRFFASPTARGGGHHPHPLLRFRPRPPHVRTADCPAIAAGTAAPTRLGHHDDIEHREQRRWRRRR